MFAVNFHKRETISQSILRIITAGRVRPVIEKPITQDDFGRHWSKNPLPERLQGGTRMDQPDSSTNQGLVDTGDWGVSARVDGTLVAGFRRFCAVGGSLGEPGGVDGFVALGSL